MGDQMADRRPDYIRKAKSDEKVLVLKENGNVVFTKPYTRPDTCVTIQNLTAAPPEGQLDINRGAAQIRTFQDLGVRLRESRSG